MFADSTENGLILGRFPETGSIMGIPCVPLIRHLLST